MARKVPEEELQAIEGAVRSLAEPASIDQIMTALGGDTPRRTLQHRLKILVDDGRLQMTGERRWARYCVRAPEGQKLVATETRIEPQGELFIPLSKSAASIQQYVRRPVEARKPVGYERAFLEGYRPNETAYLSAKERAHLRKVGTPQIAEQPAGTYAKQVLTRLLIDLSWNSSRLEGNTYSLIDTKRLIEFGQQAEGKDQVEAQMILNHKDAIEFLVGEADEIGFNRYTVLNLHGMLANNLLADPDAPGRIRHIGVGIEGSDFHPLEVPQAIEECFDQILATAAAIIEPFEQAFFVMVQLPYLQPFDDVNKRVSRLSANIPLIKANLAPLSFIDVPKQTYTEGMLGVYEQNKMELLKDVFIWAYGRSAARYAAVRQSLGEPDPFRLNHRESLRLVVAEVIRGRMNKEQAVAHVAQWAKEEIEEADREQFREVAEGELLSLHEGNFARYRVSPNEFKEWQKVWGAAATAAQN